MNDNVRVYHVDEYCEGASHFCFSERKDVVLLEDYEKLRDENERLNGENAKLRCTALHAMIGYGKWAVYTCHYKYRHGIMYIRWCDFTDKVKKAYRKAKKELKEGK